MSHPFQLIKQLREAGAVKRCHTHAGPTYNIAEHSFGVASILIALMPQRPSAELLRAALTHDVPERWTGDTPAWAKWASPELARALEALEERILESLGLEEELTPYEARWLKAADSLELWLWCKEQAGLGWTWAGAIIENLEAHLGRNPPPPEVLTFMDWHRQHPGSLPDALP